MLKTCPLDSKTTRTDRRKFIHSWILQYPIPSFILDKEVQHSTGKWICDNNFEFSGLDAVTRWQHCCSQCFTCHSTELLLLPTTHNQLCIWCEPSWLNSKSCAIFPTSGMYRCWRWCSKAPFQNARVFSWLRKICVAFVWQLQRVTTKCCQFSFISSKLKPVPPYRCCYFCKLLFLQQVSTLRFSYKKQTGFFLS